MDELELANIPKEVRNDPGTELPPRLHSQYRGGVGQLQWLQMQGNPLVSFDTSLLQSKCAGPNGHDLLQMNKVMRTAKHYSKLTTKIVAVPKHFTWLLMADAAWANRPDGTSTAGHLILAVHSAVWTGQKVQASLLSWNSKKIKRKVRSSLGAETQGFPTGLEHADLVRVFWGELCGDLAELSEYEQYLRQTPALGVNDCKSLAYALNNSGSAASKTSDDKRLAIEISMVKQRLQRAETSYQWVDGTYMAADVLTKGTTRGNIDCLIRLMTESSLMTKPTQEMLDHKATVREKKQKNKPKA